MPPATGTVAGRLPICDPPAQTAAEIADALQMSRSAVGNAVAQLESFAIARRTRPARVSGPTASWSTRPSARSRWRTRPITPPGVALARYGLEALRDTPLERRARLLELAAFAEFLMEATPRLAAEWIERRDALSVRGFRRA